MKDRMHQGETFVDICMSRDLDGCIIQGNSSGEESARAGIAYSHHCALTRSLCIAGIRQALREEIKVILASIDPLMS
jgi:hypothetical protein